MTKIVCCSEVEFEVGKGAAAGAVLAEAEREVEGVGRGHGAGVGVEDGAGVMTCGGARDCFGDQGSGQAAALEGGTDEEALDLAFGGSVGESAVSDAGCGLAVHEREQDFAVAGGVGGGHGADFAVEDGVVGAAGLRGAQPLAVFVEEGLSGGGIAGHRNDGRHETMIRGWWGYAGRGHNLSVGASYAAGHRWAGLYGV
jgi:hypothetical protein